MSKALFIDRAYAEAQATANKFYEPISELEKAIRKHATDRARKIDDIVLPALKPWQRYIVLHSKSHFLQRIVSITSGIEIEYGRPLITYEPSLQRSTAKTWPTIIKQHGKVIGKV